MKYSYKPFILLCILMLLCQPCLKAQDTPLVHFGIITDIQYADKDTRGSRLYRNSLSKLDSCIDAFNRENLDFTINLGDLVDEGPKDLPPVLDRLHKLHAKCYNLPGNHDYQHLNNNDKDGLYKKLEMPAPYYSFDVQNWRFVVLNTNELSEYATVKGTKKYRQWQVLQDLLKAQGRQNDEPYNGGMGEKQIKWMEKKIKDAQKNSKNVIVFSHHPLYPDNGLEALNNHEILNVLEKYPNVKAAFSGHHHPGNFAVYKGIPFVTFQGMVETNKNAYGNILIYPDRIEIRGVGRLESRTLKL